MDKFELALKRACDVPEPDTSYFLPWSLGMLYQVEPELAEIAARTVAQKRRRVLARHLTLPRRMPHGNCWAGMPVIHGGEVAMRGIVSLTTS